MISMMLCLVFSPWRGVTVEDSDFIREEIDIFPGLDDSIPPGIESDNYDSEGDDNSTSLPEFESFHVDYPIWEIQLLMWWKTSPLMCLIFWPTHPTLHMDFDFIPSHNDLGSDLDVSSPSEIETRFTIRGYALKIAPDFEASRARGFVLRSLELQSSTLLRESNILILSTNVLSLALLNNGFGFT
ncbi:hypothetical protein Tco_1392427 [Tanacetum coccineum]